MTRTRVLQTRQVSDINIVLEDDPGGGRGYQVAIIKKIPSFYRAMDFLRDSEKRLRQGQDVSFKDYL